ncbi:hypothetical protein FIA58_014235 [Flavobacterium jejuense]|uniref:YARHG domain-containing protein n=1 Tax=Flavobacterium jejuense TaxID=1544455 RepID=A0ABX0ISK3_9FLAO|nr:hypothetical protein [Flavobacterium jejuense]NHN26840.1 hypothetical protein [Flavobacterium jejuense]
MMKYITAIIVSLLFNSSFSQLKVLKDFDFQNKNYKFFFYESYNGQKSKDSIIKPFAISDSKKLEELKNSWIGNNEATEIPDCGYDYTIYVIEEDSLVSTLSVNTVCGHIHAFGKETSFDFTPNNPFKSLIKDSDVYAGVFTSSVLLKSRRLYALLKNQKNIYYKSVEYDNWVNYDGQFSYNIYSKNENIELKNRNEIIEDLYNKFNNDDVFIKYSSISTNSLGGYIYCSSAFYEELKNNIPIWNDFELTLSKIGIWEPWSNVYSRKYYSAYLFTNDEKKLDELIEKVKNIEGLNDNSITIKKY